MPEKTANTLFAIIGGTGFYHPLLLEELQELEVQTPYGNVLLQFGGYRGKKVLFMARHGKSHHLPPHRINYRANIWALAQLNVNFVLSSAAVGSLRPDIPPGTLLLIDQFIDFTKSREQTFFDGSGNEVVHTDFTDPYCFHLRQHLAQVLQGRGISFLEKGTYVCTEGPRYETPAEIKAFASLGGDVVGMTNVPEVTLARELGLCYANLSLVTNFAAGISDKPLTHQEVIEEMEANINLIRGVFLETIATLPENKNCRCDFKENIKLGET